MAELEKLPICLECFRQIRALDDKDSPRRHRPFRKCSLCGEDAKHGMFLEIVEGGDRAA